jgi:hypothetical protein
VDGFVFLAVRRFDRKDSGGRVGVHSLAAIDGALYGEGSGSWGEMADRLYVDGLISASDQKTIQHVWDFGKAIRNTDMHFGNLGFHPTSNGAFALAPVYDMLPMAYAPNAAGVPEFKPGNQGFTVVPPNPMANDFWERLSLDTRVSQSFKNIARQHWQND